MTSLRAGQSRAGGGSTFRHFLAYGHRDQKLFRGRVALYDGLTIPGTIAAYYQQGTGGFVLAQRKPYFIDPRTPIFQAPFPRDRLRASHLELAAKHGPLVEAQVRSGPIDPTTLSTAQAQAIVQAVLTFQQKFSQDSTQKVAKYLKILKEDVTGVGFLEPAWFVPPYFRSEQTRDPVYNVSLAMARFGATVTDPARVHPVVCLTPQALLSPTAGLHVGTDYSAFPQTLIYISGFEEANANETELAGFWTLVRELASRERPAFMLYGGYFSILAQQAGLRGLSHGLGYGEARNAFSPSSGPPRMRFYIPQLHHFFDLADAQAILSLDARRRNLFRCDCAQCHAARNAGRQALDTRTLEDAFVHFLHARRAELADVQTRGLDDLLDELANVHTYVSTLNPALVDEFAYLDRWARAIRSAG